MQKLLLIYVTLILLSSASVVNATPYKFEFTATVDRIRIHNGMEMDGLGNDVNIGTQFNGWFMFDDDWMGYNNFHIVESYVNCPVDKVGGGNELPGNAAIWVFEGSSGEVEYWGSYDNVGFELSIQSKSFTFFGLNQENNEYFSYHGSFMKPVPEPATWLLMGLGLILLRKGRKIAQR